MRTRWPAFSGSGSGRMTRSSTLEDVYDLDLGALGEPAGKALGGPIP